MTSELRYTLFPAAGSDASATDTAEADSVLLVSGEDLVSGHFG